MLSEGQVQHQFVPALSGTVAIYLNPKFPERSNVPFELRLPVIAWEVETRVVAGVAMSSNFNPKTAEDDSCRGDVVGVKYPDGSCHLLYECYCKDLDELNNSARGRSFALSRHKEQKQALECFVDDKLLCKYQ